MNDYDIKKMYEEMEIHLIRSMKRNYKLHLNEEDETGHSFPQWQAMKLKELKRYQRQNKAIVDYDTKGYRKTVAEYLKKELREGSFNAFKQYRQAMGSEYKANKRLNSSFFRVNDKKLNTLVKVVNNDLKTANKAVLRMSNDQYRQVIHKSAMYVATGTMTPAQAIDMANKDFLKRGLNVIEYKDGRRVNVASYSQMAIRTAGQRATLMGEGAFRKEFKQHLVRVTTHGTSCPLCQKWQGKILIDDVYGGGSKKDGNYPLLSDAMKQGFLHPNCKHGLTTYFGGDDDISDINESYANGKDGSESDRQYQDDLNYINLKIKEYNRLENGSLSADNVDYYHDRKTQWQKIKPVDYVDIKDTAMVYRKIRGYERNIVNLDKESTYAITQMGRVMNFTGKSYEVDIPAWLNLENAIVTHNHPMKETHYSLSAKDILFFLNRNLKELRGIDEKYIYYVRKTNKVKYTIEDIKQDIKDFRLEALELSDKGLLDIDEDEYDFINKKLSKKYGFSYSRRKRR